MSETTRTAIIKILSGALRPLDYVNAMWEGGSAAFGRVDEWSDIDLMVDVKDGRIEDTFDAAEKALEDIGGIECSLRIPEPSWHGFSQKFYRLAGTSEYLLIDLAVIRESIEDKFLAAEIHGRAVFHFNKDNAVKPVPLDRKAFSKKVRKLFDRERTKFEMFQSMVTREINRDYFISALDSYRRITLNGLIIALRIKHNVFHFDFGTACLYMELPDDVVKRLEALFIVNDMEDLREKHRLACEWFSEEADRCTGCIDKIDSASADPASPDSRSSVPEVVSD